MSDRQTDGQTYKNYSSEFYNKIDVHLYQHKTMIVLMIVYHYKLHKCILLISRI